MEPLRRPFYKEIDTVLQLKTCPALLARKLYKAINKFPEPDNSRISAFVCLIYVLHLRRSWDFEIFNHICVTNFLLHLLL